MRLTKNKKLDKRFRASKTVNRWFNKDTFKAMLLGIALGTAFGLYLVKKEEVSLDKVGQTIVAPVIETKALEIPCDYDAITYVRCRGQQLGYKDTEISVFIRIARCESGFRPMAKNPNSTATGIYQFINGTFHRYCKGKNVYDFKDNIDCFYKVLETDGYPKALSHWNASKTCWYE